MKILKKPLQIISFGLIATFGCIGQAMDPLTNKDVVQMVTSGISYDIIKSKIDNSKCAFDTSVAALASLKKSQVPDNVVILLTKTKCDFVDMLPSQPPNQPNKVSNVPIAEKEIVITTLTDLDAFPEKFENKVVFFEAELKDIRREEEGVFMVGMASGDISAYSNNYKYVSPVLGKSGINIVSYAGITAENLLALKQSRISSYRLFGGSVKRLETSSGLLWLLSIFDSGYQTVYPNVSLVGRALAVTPNTLLETSTTNYGDKYFAKYVEWGARIDFQDVRGRTALMNAAYNGSKSVLGELLELGASVNVTDKDGRTALFHGITSGSAGICEKLIKAGASVDIADSKGESLIGYATKKGDKAILKVLLRASKSK